METLTPAPDTEFKSYEFFLVGLPGLEDLLQREIKEWFPQLNSEAQYGGVTVHAPLETGLAMNLALKIPTRILLRLARFRARDFPKLFRKVKEFPWEEWLDLSCELEVFAACKRSRLKIKSRIEETCLDAWIAVQRSHGLKPDPEKKAKLYVRVVDDEVTLSLDTSGERLHKRGVRTHVGTAPLRETIAAALIQMVAMSLEADGVDESTGTLPDIEVIDPMMGSGTFILEALTRNQLVDAREFAFQSFARRPETLPQLQSNRPKIIGAIGFEQDSKAMRAAKANLKELALSQHNISLIGENFFEAEPMVGKTVSRWVFVNPPYGERLKVQGSLLEFYEKLFVNCERVARPDRACFLLPAAAVKGKFALPPNWKVLEKRRFLNGGIPVVAFLFGRKA